MSNIFGRHLKMITFGESHGPGMGVVIDGLPSGVPIRLKFISQMLERRRPGQNQFVSSRQEADEFEVLSGMLGGISLGTPLSFVVRNKNQKSEDYKNLKPRPGHGDQVWLDKYDHVDLRGGGRSSGRETLSRVIAGAVAMEFIANQYPEFEIYSGITQMGPLELGVPDTKPQWPRYQPPQNQLGCFTKEDALKVQDLLAKAKADGESYGGSVKFSLKQVPKSLGQPVFAKLKADLTSAFMGVGAVSGVSLGSAVKHKGLKGTEFHQNPKNYGGVSGGISTGEDIEFDIFFKPTSSILDVAKKGRHDPCIIPRALVVLEAMAAFVIADHILLARCDNTARE